MGEDTKTVETEVGICSLLKKVSPLYGKPTIIGINASKRHNAAHDSQKRKFAEKLGIFGPLVFWCLYVTNHFRYGFQNNPFEIEAQKAEHGKV